mgnify:CR=1 FL=1
MSFKYMYIFLEDCLDSTEDIECYKYLCSRYHNIIFNKSRQESDMYIIDYQNIIWKLSRQLILLMGSAFG